MKKKWKLLTAMLLVVSMMVSLAACGGNNNKRKRKDDDKTETTVAETKETKPVETEPEEETTEEENVNEDLVGVWYYTDGSKELHFDGVDTFQFVEYMEDGEIVNTEGEYWFDGVDIDMLDTEGMDLQGWMGADGYLHFEHWDSYFVPEGLTPDVDLPEEILDGWWVHTGEDESESMPKYFTLYGDGTWNAYDDFGTASETMEFSYEDELLILDTEYDYLEFVYIDGCLYSADDELEYIYVTVSPFDEEEGLLDGNWYQNGSTYDSFFYEIAGENYAFYELEEEIDLIESGLFALESVDYEFGDYVAEDVIRLEMTDKDLVLSPDTHVLFLDDGVEYAIYVNEDYVSQDMVDRYRMMSQIMNMDVTAEPEEGLVYKLTFTPYCFYASAYIADDDTGLTDADLTVYGQWSITEEGTLELIYEDGTTDTVVAPTTEDTVLYVPSLEADFAIEYPW